MKAQYALLFVVAFLAGFSLYPADTEAGLALAGSGHDIGVITTPLEAWEAKACSPCDFDLCMDSTTGFDEGPDWWVTDIQCGFGFFLWTCDDAVYEVSSSFAIEDATCADPDVDIYEGMYQVAFEVY